MKHCIVCIADAATAFRSSARSPTVEISNKHVFKYYYGLLFELLAWDYNCYHDRRGTDVLSTAVNAVRPSESVVNNHRPLRW